MNADSYSPLIEIDRVRRRFRVDRAVYRDADVFLREREIIFKRCWLYAFHESEMPIPGDYVCRNVGGQDFIFVRSRSGQVNGFYNSCTHRGMRVCQEQSGNRKVFTCPYHGWVFDQDGKLRSQSAASGYDADFNDDGLYNLRTVPRLESYRGWYFINFNAHAVDLVTYLDGARDNLDLIADQSELGLEVISGGQEFTCRANWKMMMENQFDSYHGTALHRSYFEFLKTVAPNVGSFDLAAGFTRALGNGHGVFQTSAVTGRPIAQWIPPFGEHARGEIEALKSALTQRHGAARAQQIAETNRNFVIFPNMVLNDNFSISARSIFPISPGEMRVTIWAMGPKEESEHFRRLRLDNYLSFTGPAGFATPDDIEIFEATQRAGLSGWSDVSKGMRADDDLLHATAGTLDEAQVRGWWTQWDRVLSGAETLSAAGSKED